MSRKKNPSVIMTAAGFISGLFITLQKRVAQKGGSDADLYRLGTPEGEATLNLIAELIVKAGRKSAKATLPLLKFLGSVAIPATIEQFIAADRFMEDTSDEARVNISHVGYEFKVWFSNKIEELHPATELYYHQLTQPSVDGPIIVELGGEKKAETTLAEMYCLMERQNKGEQGALLTMGYANIFYIRDVDGILRRVDVFRRGIGWFINAYDVELPDRWHADERVFSRYSLFLAA